MASLWHNTKGLVGKDEFLDSYDDWFMVNVVGRPNANVDSKDKHWYDPVERHDPLSPKIIAHETGIKNMFMLTTGKAMRTIGCSDEEIEERFQQWAASYQGPEKF